MITPFYEPRNNATTTVAVARTAGAGSLAVASGSAFGSTFPVRVTAVRAGNELAILAVSGRTGNTLTISGAIEGTSDVNLIVGDTIEHRTTRGAFSDLHTAVNAAEGAIDDLTSAVAQGAAIANATDSTDVVTQLNLLLAFLRSRGDIAT